jgi:hypothetical protein
VSSTTGRIPLHVLTRPVTLTSGRAAYASGGLHPTVAKSGRYAMPTEGRVYKWRDPDGSMARFQKREAVERALAQS